jgi:hypothetical protein
MSMPFRSPSAKAELTRNNIQETLKRIDAAGDCSVNSGADSSTRTSCLRGMQERPTRDDAFFREQFVKRTG